MAKQHTQGLAEARDRLSRWRMRHGGRGIPIPDEFWAIAVDLSVVHGVAVTARSLGVDRKRLERLAECLRRSPAVAVHPPPSQSPPAFIELSTSLPSREHIVVRLTGRDGEQLELSLADGMLDVALLVREFWSRAR